MPNVPCSSPAQNCEGTENPLANLSAEGPDIAKCFRYAFTPSSTRVCEFDLTFCQQLTAIGGDVAIFCDPPPPPEYNPPLPIIYSSSAQSCVVDCGGFSEEYAVAPGTFVGLSQAEADARADAFACQLAAIQCTGSFAVFTSSAQGCAVVCPDQTTYTFLLPAGLFSALSQSEANFDAYLFSCEVAALLCSGLPPLAIQQSAGVPPLIPAQPLWANFAQSCSSTCSNGSIYVFTVPGGTYLRESRLAANLVAQSAACRLASLSRACLSDLPASICVDDFVAEFVTTA